jgi:hypothetical protein
MKFSLHSLLFFVPDEVSGDYVSTDVIYNIVTVILCIILVFSLVLLYRRIQYGSPEGMTEGMTEGREGASPSESPKGTTAKGTTIKASAEVQNIKKQTTGLQTTFDQLKAGVDDQTNRINGNSHMLLKTMSDTPNQMNSVTHANINQDDPSKTNIPQINMS